MGFQKSPPAGSDFALRATQGQSRLLEAHTSSPKTLGVENRAKSFLEAPVASLKNFMWKREELRRAKVDFWKPTPPRQKLYVLEEKGLFYFLIKFSCTCAMLKRYFQSVS